MAIKQFLSAHAALEQSWCNHRKAANRNGRRSDQDAAMIALESALVVHSAATSGLQEGMRIFDPTVVVSLQTSRQQAQSFKTAIAEANEVTGPYLHWATKGPPTTIVEQTSASYKSMSKPHQSTPAHMIITAGKLVSLATRVTTAMESAAVDSAAVKSAAVGLSQNHSS